MKPIYKKLLLALGVVLVLLFAFWYGGNAPGLRGWTMAAPPSSTIVATATPTPSKEAAVSPPPISAITPMPTPTEAAPPSETPEPAPDPSATTSSRPVVEAGGLSADEKVALAQSMTEGAPAGVEQGDAAYSQLQGMTLNPQTGKDKYLTDPVPEGKPMPVEPQEMVIGDIAYTCTISVRCDTILDNLDWLDPEKKELVPEDGVIFPATEVTFYEGESVFDVLLREMKSNSIHMEFVNTPIYNSAYIEGINNLYEFDCGELSGWMYRVNDWFPNYGCSRYQLLPGDVVEWVYTCTLGVDVGGFSAAGG